MKGDSAGTFEIFNLDVTMFDVTSGISFDVSDSIESILINVNGRSSVNISKVDFSAFKSYPAKLLWNFNNVTSLTLDHVAFYGNILAIDADVSASAGVIQGNAYVHRWMGNLQVNTSNSDLCWDTYVAMQPARINNGEPGDNGASSSTYDFFVIAIASFSLFLMF